MDEPKLQHPRTQWIDAHHHLWRYSEAEYPWMSAQMQAIRRDFSVHDLAIEANVSGVTGTVAVQARQSVEETEWLLTVAQSSLLVKGVVGWVPLIDPNVTEWLDKWKSNPLLKGVRHILHDEADDEYMLRPDFNAGIRALMSYGLRYDLLIFERHLPQTISFVDQHPNQVFILDHIAKPRIRDGALDPWRINISRLAERPHVYCKLSGMATEANVDNWNSDTLKPYFDHVLEAFGPSRIMFGSDWPVLNLASSYATWVQIVDQWLSNLNKAEADAIRRDTAIRIYGLDPQL
ncbi:amidohydrolase family protein [Terracidiphilus gabretensis]|jgi:L-fuconolactonase|uniref:amidohydrolase family protein n=1 Tax=Terracidiphilus gabretensis TaxID=1577687 RepID=UPI00071B5028|nr:amidohydrolase family protein [Terracidiphilus gabretensis]